MKKNRNEFYWIFSLTLLLGVILISACTNEKDSAPYVIEAADTAVQTPIPSQTPKDNNPDFQTYRNDIFGFEIQFPKNWYGPDVYTWEEGIRIAIGSDVVYPYGTDRLDQNYTIENSYYITIQFEKRNNGLADGTYLEILRLEDGQSIETPRSLVTRIRELQVDGFSGVEYVTTLPEAAQTEMVYIRGAVLFDQENNYISISGSPNNVQLASRENWREQYRAVDQLNQEIFQKIIDTISVF